MLPCITVRAHLNENLSNQVTEAGTIDDIENLSDHSPILLEIDFTKFERGRGFWKFNTSLLKDIAYVNIVNETIKRVTCQYAYFESRPDFF